MEALRLTDDDREAQLALKGLDRIEVEGRPERTYDGPRDPDALLEHFGYDEFRPGQREAVQAALEGRDSLVVMPISAIRLRVAGPGSGSCAALRLVGWKPSA